MVTGSGFGGSSLPQNPGVGQKTCRDRNILGSGKIDGIEEMTIVKLSHQLDRSLPLNDFTTLEPVSKGIHPPPNEKKGKGQPLPDFALTKE
jgi:hypothetical protein